jgi:hypothetical protein
MVLFPEPLNQEKVVPDLTSSPHYSSLNHAYLQQSWWPVTDQQFPLLIEVVISHAASGNNNHKLTCIQLIR